MRLKSYQANYPYFDLLYDKSTIGKCNEADPLTF